MGRGVSFRLSKSILIFATLTARIKTLEEITFERKISKVMCLYEKQSQDLLYFL